MKETLLTVLCVIMLTGCGSQKTSYRVLSDVYLAKQAFASEAQAGQELPAVFSTAFNTKDRGRSHNIKLASEFINDTVIYPDEEFSFNTSVGPTTKANGFKIAMIFIEGKKKKDYGGGVCQVSSTLYNAALDAGMDITERHPHSLRVYYVDEGRDAATSYGGKDLKFVNNKQVPVVVKSWIVKGQVYTALEEYEE